MSLTLVNSEVTRKP